MAGTRGPSSALDVMASATAPSSGAGGHPAAIMSDDNSRGTSSRSGGSAGSSAGSAGPSADTSSSSAYEVVAECRKAESVVGDVHRSIMRLTKFERVSQFGNGVGRMLSFDKQFAEVVGLNCFRLFVCCLALNLTVPSEFPAR